MPKKSHCRPIVTNRLPGAREQRPAHTRTKSPAHGSAGPGFIYTASGSDRRRHVTGPRIPSMRIECDTETPSFLGEKRPKRPTKHPVSARAPHQDPHALARVASTRKLLSFHQRPTAAARAGRPDWCIFSHFCEQPIRSSPEYGRGIFSRKRGKDAIRRSPLASICSIGGIADEICVICSRRHASRCLSDPYVDYAHMHPASYCRVDVSGFRFASLQRR